MNRKREMSEAATGTISLCNFSPARAQVLVSQNCVTPLNNQEDIYGRLKTKNNKSKHIFQPPVNF